jgi:ATP-dependent protease ClpP protease subunit
MAEILLYDYYETVEDPFWGDTYEVFYCIGQGKLSAAVINQQINQSSGELMVRINSCGGLVFDGWAIYNALVNYAKISGNSVIVRIEGLAASIASVIAMASSKIIMCQASMLMVHKPYSFFCGSLDASTAQAEANSLNEIETVIIDIYSSKTGLSSQKLQNMIDVETWLAPDTALALGFCDEIEKIEREKPIIPQNVFNKLFNGAGANTMAYVNSAFTITNVTERNMSTVKELNEKQEQTNSLLTDILNVFKKKPANNADAPAEEPAAAEEPVVTEGDELATLKVENEQLKAEKAANAETVANAQEIMNKANAKFDEVTNLLKEIKSNYKPEAREENSFSNEAATSQVESKFVKPTKTNK